MITYVIILFVVYMQFKNCWIIEVKVDEEFVLATSLIFSWLRVQVIEDADLLKPPVKYFFITPLIFFVIFAICLEHFSSQDTSKDRENKELYPRICNCRVVLSLAGLQSSFIIVLLTESRHSGIQSCARYNIDRNRQKSFTCDTHDLSSKQGVFICGFSFMLDSLQHILV